MAHAQTSRALVLEGWLVARKAWGDHMVQCAGVLLVCWLEQVLAVIYVGQVRGACLPCVINGTEVGSSGVVKVMQATDYVTLFLMVWVVRHLILSLFPNALY